MVTFDDIKQAQTLISPYIQRTPIMQSSLLNGWLGHEIFFKAECLQTTGAFKLRGAIHFLSQLKKHNALPKHIVANSSGNHAQAVAYAGRLFNVPVTIYSAKNISPIKAAATESYGATLNRFDTRVQADVAVKAASEQEGVVWIPPFNHPYIIAGQGTAALEALKQVDDIDMIAAPCGGGGLLSGTIVTARALNKNIDVVGAEPLAANDAARSLRENRIMSLTEAPNTLADGAATPSVGEHTFEILKSVDAFHEVDESSIIYWTQWLQHLLKLHIEPTCAMTMQAVVNYLSQQQTKKRVMVIISGGNISQTSMHKIWEYDCLDTLPSLGLATRI
ncbi:serine/threonine dehydratase [Glaciecola sp. XM2]|jgi:threonine dehydratase|uniref:serine/threonine dehydratase n=1 Tax=Glaciecola sp. XM2 TaxID=1914931 RepID=UPI001BDE87A9|nr:serine/threonine dehydratase [Glaciecola sp. XM2]MBT1451112.1 serine/threonine dehydratase [Glaciecola sp. XM2]